MISTETDASKYNEWKVPYKSRADSGRSLRFVTFNVAGIKNVLNYKPWNEKRCFERMFEILDADIICFQETKIQKKDLEAWMAMIDGYDSYFSFPSVKKGYSGVAFYVRQGIPVLKAEQGLTGFIESDDFKGKRYRDLEPEFCIGGYPEFLDEKSALDIDSEGRCVVLDLGFCVVIGLYCPANSTGDRQDFKEAFNDVLDSRIRKLAESGREVVVMGDLNICPTLLDTAEGRREFQKQEKLKKFSAEWDEFMESNADAVEEWGHTTQGRALFNKWIGEGLLVDTSRMHNPKRLGMYTCWNQYTNARPGNFGSRIDFVLTTKGIECPAADILPHLLGSDHCPVFADIIGSDATADASNGISQPPKLCSKWLPSFGRKTTIADLFANYSKKKRPLSNDDDSPPSAEPSPPARQSPPRTAANNSNSRTKKPKQGQATLASFFAPAPPSKDATEATHDAVSMRDSSQESDMSQSSEPKTDDPAAATRRPSQGKWQEIFKPKEPPLCSGHNEPCILQTTKRKGSNKGRRFWSCAR